MTAFPGSSERDVVPDWRPVARSLQTGEFSASSHRSIDVGVEQVAEQRSAFLRFRGEFAAADLIGAASALGLPEESLPPGVHLLAHTFGDDEQALPSRDLLSSRIHNLRVRLREDPRDAYAHIDLALLYLNVGQLDQAQASVLRAKFLRPNSRFVLRAASRLQIHIGDLDAAVALLSNPAHESEDPWLLAPLLAASEMAGKPVGRVRLVRELLSDGRWSPRALSELASQMGTLELRSGKSKVGNSLVHQSLKDPNDNALAQAAWARTLGFELPTDQLEVRTGAHEARARVAATEWRWESALEAARQWVTDQPFSTSAGAYMGWVAAMADFGYDEAVEVLRLTLSANPGDATVSNNLAYCLIQQGELEEARTLLYSTLEKRGPLDEEVVLATRGMLRYREGDVTVGRQLYRQSVEDLVDQGALGHAHAASINWALEELRAVPDSKDFAREVLSGTEDFDNPAVQYLRQRLLLQIES